MLNDKDQAEEKEDHPTSLSLAPKEPAGAKHAPELPEHRNPRTAHRVQSKPFDIIKKPAASHAPEQSPTKPKTVAPPKQPIKKDENKDKITEHALSHGPFKAHRDPFSIDFEKVAAQRAAK